MAGRRPKAAPRARAREGGGSSRATGSRSRRRLIWLSSSAFCVALAAVVLLTQIGSSAHQASAAEARARIDRHVRALLAGIPQQGNTLGSPRAPITLQVFGDLECLDVKYWFRDYLPAIINDFVRPNVLRIEYHAMETDTLWPRVFVAEHTAALAAGTQDQMWNFLATFYYEQGIEYTRYVTEQYLEGIAEQVPGLDLTRWNNDRVISLAKTVVADNKTARSMGFYDTPAFRIGQTGGPLRKLSGRYIIIYKKFRFRPGPHGETIVTPIPHSRAHPLSLIEARDIKKAIGKEI
jgi:protein-disulfide isomerase